MENLASHDFIVFFPSILDFIDIFPSVEVIKTYIIDSEAM